MNVAALLVPVLALVLGLAGALIVLSPLVRPRSTDAMPAQATSAPEVTEALARDALREVEFDYRLGNLAADDYGALRTRYEDRAIEAMRERLAGGSAEARVERPTPAVTPAAKAKPANPPRRGGRPTRRGGHS